MTVTLVTIEGVELVSTGTYQLASGETTFSQEDLADAVLAAQDPTVPAPRLKLGHTDPRFDEAIAAGDLDGEPAFGSVQNLRLSDDGQTVIGDYVDVPEWLADTIQSAYPGRSIEGGFAYTAPSGRQYRLVIARVALLGVTWPGVTSLADLREILEQNGDAETPEQVAAGVDSLVMARVARPAETQADDSAVEGARDVLAGMDLGSVRMAFCGDLDEGDVPSVPDSQPGADEVGSQMWWWPRSVRVEDDGTVCLIVDDDEGHLIRIPFTVDQTDLQYGQPQLVVETYVPVTSEPVQAGERVLAGARTIPLARIARTARARSNPSSEVSATMRINGSEVDAAALRQRLGLADDADDAAIYNALGIPETTPDTETTASTGEQPSIPEGMVLVDAETLESVRQGAEQGAAVAARLATEDRDRIILAAVQDGKFPPSRREHYETAWARDPDGTRSLLTASVEEGGLAAGLVPTGGRETGVTGDGENGQSDHVEHAAFMERHFPQASARLRGNDRRVTVRQEA